MHQTGFEFEPRSYSATEKPTRLTVVPWELRGIMTISWSSLYPYNALGIIWKWHHEKINHILIHHHLQVTHSVISARYHPLVSSLCDILTFHLGKPMFVTIILLFSSHNIYSLILHLKLSCPFLVLRKRDTSALGTTWRKKKKRESKTDVLASHEFCDAATDDWWIFDDEDYFSVLISLWSKVILTDHLNLALLSSLIMIAWSALFSLSL